MEDNNQLDQLYNDIFDEITISKNIKTGEAAPQKPSRQKNEKLIIRPATVYDIDTIFMTEAKLYSLSESSSKEVLKERITHYGDHFWLMFEGNRLAAYVYGLVTNEPDLTDEMYENADMHNEAGRWQMILGMTALPEYRKKVYTDQLIKRFIDAARVQGRYGLVLICKDQQIKYYERLGFKNEGSNGKSFYGGVEWKQMRLIINDNIINN